MAEGPGQQVSLQGNVLLKTQPDNRDITLAAQQQHVCTELDGLVQ